MHTDIRLAKREAERRQEVDQHRIERGCGRSDRLPQQAGEVGWQADAEADDVDVELEARKQRLR